MSGAGGRGLGVCSGTVSSPEKPPAALRTKKGTGGRQRHPGETADHSKKERRSLRSQHVPPPRRGKNSLIFDVKHAAARLACRPVRKPEPHQPPRPQPRLGPACAWGLGLGGVGQGHFRRGLRPLGAGREPEVPPPHSPARFLLHLGLQGWGPFLNTVQS